MGTKKIYERILWQVYIFVTPTGNIFRFSYAFKILNPSFLYDLYVLRSLPKKTMNLSLSCLAGDEWLQNITSIISATA